MTDLAARAIHCCYGGNWPSRLGGVAALHRLVLRLPAAALPRLAPMAAKALFAVLRILPESAGAEEDLSGVLMALLQRCGPGEAVPPAAEAGSVDCSVAPAAVPASDAAVSIKLDDQRQLPPLVRQMMEICVQQLLSSRSSVAARAVASIGLQASGMPFCCTHVTALYRYGSRLFVAAPADARHTTWKCRRSQLHAPQPCRTCSSPS